MGVGDQGGDSGRKFAWKLNQSVTRDVQKFIYRRATRRLHADDVVFLNYGYEEEPAMDVPLSDADEANRFPIQLYHRTATQADIGGKRVLEVGCGHGGGASYLMRALKPAAYTGLDLNSSGITFCRKRHRLDGLDFMEGDAEKLPVEDQAFDAVINIESSHLYPGFPRFLDEVARVLRPGGHFLYADLRADFGIAEWERELAAAPLRMVSQRSINDQVVRGMEKSLQQWHFVIERVAPALLRGMLRRYDPPRRACDDLRSGGSTEYRMYCFVKE